MEMIDNINKTNKISIVIFIFFGEVLSEFFIEILLVFGDEMGIVVEDISHQILGLLHMHLT